MQQDGEDILVDVELHTGMFETKIFENVNVEEVFDLIFKKKIPIKIYKGQRSRWVKIMAWRRYGEEIHVDLKFSGSFPGKNKMEDVDIREFFYTMKNKKIPFKISDIEEIRPDPESLDPPTRDFVEEILRLRE